ncbi:MAG: hypothetical protein WBQ66_07610, partial [Blastocatellia bacterium]
GIVYNPGTGNATRVGGIKGDSGGAVKIGDNVFAGKDGNVYRKGENGWNQVGRDQPKAGERDSMRMERQGPDRDTMERLDREQKNRDLGQKRSKDFSSYDRSRSVDRGRAPSMSNRGSYGGGGMRGGGMRGGGMRGGGGRRR